LKAVHDRQEVKLSASQADALRQCFADLDDEQQGKVYRDAKDEENQTGLALTAKGSALFAQRINYALDKDELVSNLINENIADKKLLVRLYGKRLCEFEKNFVYKLRHFDDIKATVEPIIKFIESGSCP